MNTNIAFILATFFLISCTDTTDTPTQVAEKYWDAIQRGDSQAAKQMLTNDSLEQYDNHIKSLEHITINNFVVDTAKTAATTIINPDAPAPGDEVIFETQLVLENNHWMVDLKNTRIPKPITKEQALDATSEALAKSIKKNVDSIEEALGEGMGMLNDLLREGSEDMSKSMLDAMQQLNDKMKESIEKMKQRRRNNQTAPKSTEDKTGEGLI